MHNHGICVTYRYDGDESLWAATIARFVSAAGADPALKGKFSYTVHKGKDGASRVHVGRWDGPETVAALQSTDYFKAFAAALKDMAGDTLQTTPFSLTHST